MRQQGRLTGTNRAIVRFYDQRGRAEQWIKLLDWAALPSDSRTHRGLPRPGGSVMAKPFHLGWFLHGSSAQSWGELWTGHIGTTWMQPELFLNMARTLERACFDYLLLEDASAVNEAFDGSTEIYLKRGIAVPRQDKSVVAALMAQVTSHIGIVPTLGTYAYHPYLLARLIANEA